MDFNELIKEKGKCCVTEKPLSDCEFINLIQTKYKVKWNYPKFGNVITGEEGTAGAVVHDDVINMETGELKGELKFCIEIKNDEIIYHPVTELELQTIQTF